MIDIENIIKLIADIESDRAERTLSTTNTDKFGQAICAFANDLPAHNEPSYLIIGADDDGTIKGINVTDELLKNIAGIRTDGNIQPQPSMTVEKVVIDDKALIVVEVQSAIFPPVRYKGRIWIRVGPRKAVANEADEKRLYEKRNAGIQTFDASPCLGATIDDIDTRTFRLHYLPMAYPDDILENDKRDVKMQLQALGFYDMRYDCPTYAGIIMFGKNVERILPGAYIQYVKFKGTSRAGEVEREYKFAGNLFAILPRLDTFIETTIANRRPVPVSALREENVLDYPHWATREILMNACCHRAYDSNGPIQFYQYDDRIEILNHGGLYGKVNANNFPYVNDYRNGVIAEAMKVMGYVNRFSRGVLRVEDELKDNGNGNPEFNLTLETAFLVTVYKSKRSIDMEQLAKENFGEIVINDAKHSNNVPNNVPNVPNDGPNNIFISVLHKTVYEAIKYKPTIKLDELADNIGVSTRTIKRTLSDLKSEKLIERSGSNRHGEWRILK